METLNFLRSGEKHNKQLSTPYPALKFEFLIDTGMKGLSAMGMENPLEKLKCEYLPVCQCLHFSESISRVFENVSKQLRGCFSAYAELA